MNKILKVLRAFFLALRMTLRGEKPAPVKYAALQAWMAETERLTASVYKAADQAGLSQAARQQIKLRIEGRDIIMEAVLGGVKFHAAQEYKYLLSHETEHSLTAIYASNLNDQFRILKLREAVEQPGVRAALDALARHLESIPPSHKE